MISHRTHDRGKPDRAKPFRRGVLGGVFGLGVTLQNSSLRWLPLTAILVRATA
jgi:hypothetical protein